MSPKSKIEIEKIKIQKRQKILDAAEDLFSNHGYEATSISQIAKQAGISKGLIYTYFESKDKILERLLLDVFEMMKNRMGFYDAKELTDDQYIHFINTSFDIVLENPVKWKLYISLFTQPQVSAIMFEKLMPEMTNFIRLFIDYYERKGIEDPAAWMRFVAASIDGIQMHVILDPENFPVEKVRKLTLELFT